MTQSQFIDESTVTSKWDVETLELKAKSDNFSQEVHQGVSPI